MSAEFSFRTHHASFGGCVGDDTVGDGGGWGLRADEG